MEALSHLKPPLPTHALLSLPHAVFSSSLPRSRWCLLAWRTVCVHWCVFWRSLFILWGCMHLFFVSCSISTPPCTNFFHSGRHFTLQLPSFLWIVTQNTIIHMQICFGGPPTISKYANATGGPPLFSKQSFEMNARGENLPYSLEGRKQVQMKIHALRVFQKLTKARKSLRQATSLEKHSMWLEKEKKNTLRPLN